MPDSFEVSLKTIFAVEEMGISELIFEGWAASMSCEHPTNTRKVARVDVAINNLSLKQSFEKEEMAAFPRMDIVWNGFEGAKIDRRAQVRRT